MSYISAIVLAAGKGERFKSRISKPLFYINAKPLIIYSLAALARNRSIREIIVVANRSNQKELLRKIKQYRISKVSKVVLGGLRRQDSVQNGLRQVSAHADTVLIHDGARPFIDQKILDRVIKEALLSGAAIVGVPVKATIKQVTGRYVEKTLDRSRIWEVQTPQVFAIKLIKEAYRRFARIAVTDDAMLVEKCGVRPRVVMGSYGNIKITTPVDAVMAEAIAKKCKSA